MNKICDLCTSTVKASLTSVNLASNFLWEEGANILAPAIRDSTSVTSIDLRGNKLGVEGWTTIFNTLCDSPTSKISTWDLSGEFLGPEIAKPLANYISVTASITVVDLRYNNLDTESATMLATVAKEKRISLCGITPEQTEANFSHTKTRSYMSAADAILLSADLTVRPSVTSVMLLGNNFDDATVEMLLKLKEEKPSLISLCGLALDQTEANFKGMHLRPADARLLAPEIIVRPSLTSVRHMQ